LNRAASELAVEFGLHGGTDITGYSLLGHAAEMAAASGVRIRFQYEGIPFISCAHKYAEHGPFPAGLRTTGSISERRWSSLPAWMKLPDAAVRPADQRRLLLGVRPINWTPVRRAAQGRPGTVVVVKVLEGHRDRGALKMWPALPAPGSVHGGGLDAYRAGSIPPPPQSVKSQRNRKLGITIFLQIHPIRVYYVYIDNQ